MAAAIIQTNASIGLRPMADDATRLCAQHTVGGYEVGRRYQCLRVLSGFYHHK